MKIYLFAVLAAMISLQAFAAVEGKWQGKLNLGTTTLSLAVRIAEGGKVAWMDSPDQMAFNIECDTLTVAANSITVGVKRMGILISGTLSDADNSFSGSFRQGLAKLPFEMAFVSTNPYLERPQTPQPPFPYDVEEVTFSHGDVTLTGTLTKPAGKKNLTAVVLVSGSGQQNRDEEVMGHKPFAVLADHLTRGGIAVLRYDDRGTGGSSALSPDVTTADFAQDALAAVKYLQSVPEINKKKIGVVGHSEGGQIAIMLAAEHQKDVKFISTLAAPVVKGKDLMITQNEDMARMRGIEITADQRRILEQTFAAIDTINDTDLLRNRLYHIMTDGKSAQEMINVNSQIMVMTTPWYVYFVRYCAIPHLNAMRQPMLAFYGANDVQVNATINAATLYASYGGKKLEIENGLHYNHLFQECSKPTADYGRIEQTLSPKVMQRLLDWLKQR
ncbi:MAG: alpha/beta hydrolase family protein [Muribaculaceae bacterium]